jgi:hypothetical protein
MALSFARVRVIKAVELFDSIAPSYSSCMVEGASQKNCFELLCHFPNEGNFQTLRLERP